MKRVAFIVPDKEEHKLFDFFCLEFRKKYEVFYVTSLSDLRSAHRQSPLSGIVMNWQEISYPNFVFESILQDEKLSACPVVTYFEQFAQKHLNYFKEYEFSNYLNVGLSLPIAIHKIDDLLEAEARPKSKAEKAAVARRKFFANLHKGWFSDAEIVLNEELKPVATPLDFVYYSCLKLKFQNDPSNARSCMSEDLHSENTSKQTDTRYLHLLGNIAYQNEDFEEAIKFFQVAEVQSQLNLRRKFLMAKLWQVLGHLDAALVKFNEIYFHCPIYPEIHSPLIALQYKSCLSLSDVDELLPLIGQIHGDELIKLCKTLEGENIAKVERRFKDLVIRRLSLESEDLMEDGMFQKALQNYKYIKQIIEPYDYERLKVLLFCSARLYIKAGELDLADKFIAKFEVYDKRPNARIRSLKNAIAKKRSLPMPSKDKKSA